MEERGVYKIRMDGRWSLEDLYVFPKAYEQVYFALEALLTGLAPEAESRIQRAFQAYPWHGGYSAVNFYNQLKYATPVKYRPTIISIRYASPGAIELGLVVSLAFSVGYVVKRVAQSIEHCNKVYNQIYVDAQKRKLLRIDVEKAEIQLTKDQIDFIEYSSESMARILHIPSPHAIHARTKNPLISLKILLSLYRRVRTLADYEIKQKVDLDDGRT